MPRSELWDPTELHRLRVRVDERPIPENVAEVAVLPRERKPANPWPYSAHGRVDRCIDIDRQIDIAVLAARHADANAEHREDGNFSMWGMPNF